MADPGAGWNDAELIECALGPAQEGVALEIALVLELDVAADRQNRAEQVDLNRVVDDEIGRSERGDTLPVSADAGHGIMHRGEVDHRRGAGKVLEQNASRQERKLTASCLTRLPARQLQHVVT